MTVDVALRQDGRRGTLAGWLRAVSGPHRTPGRNRQLANLLALIAGILNSVGFVAVDVYTSHMTGLTATVADHLVLGGTALVAVGVLAIASFVAGAMACAVVFNWARRRHLRSKYATVLLLEGLLILLFGALADFLTWSHRNWVFVSVLCYDGPAERHHHQDQPGPDPHHSRHRHGD